MTAAATAEFALPAGAAPVDFFDPHFHIWCVPSGVHSAATLGAPAEAFPSYSLADYQAAVAVGVAANPWVRHVGGVFVEALPAASPGD